MNLLGKDTAAYAKFREQYGTDAVFIQLQQGEEIERPIEKIELKDKRKPKEGEEVKEECKFLSEPLWRLGMTKYSGKHANTYFALMRRHVYCIKKANGTPWDVDENYYYVSSRGDTLEDQSRVVREITKEKACSLIKDVIEEDELMRIPIEIEDIPSPMCDY